MASVPTTAGGTDLQIWQDLTTSSDESLTTHSASILAAPERVRSRPAKTPVPTTESERVSAAGIIPVTGLIQVSEVDRDVSAPTPPAQPAPRPTATREADVLASQDGDIDLSQDSDSSSFFGELDIWGGIPDRVFGVPSWGWLILLLVMVALASFVARSRWMSYQRRRRSAAY